MLMPSNLGFAAGAMLARHQPKRGSEIAATSKLARGAGLGGERAGGDRSDAGDGKQALCGLILHHASAQLALEFAHLLIQGAIVFLPAL